jgi:adenylate cyclase
MRIDWLLGRDAKRRVSVIVAFLVLTSALALRALDPPALVRLRDIAFDDYQRIKPRVRPDDMPVRIVDIDEAALEEYGQWPWPRTLVAALVDKLSEKGAAVIAFDVIFAEPDRLSIGQLVRNLPADEQTSELRRLAQKFPDNDEVLARAIRNAPVVTGFAFDIKGGSRPPRRIAGVVHNSGERNAGTVPDMIAQFIPRQAGAVKTIDPLEAVAAGNGSVTPDIKATVVRRVPLLFRLAGQRNEDLFPSLALETLRVAQGASTYLVRWSGAQAFASFGERTGVGEVRVGNLSIETDARGRLILYDSGHLPKRYVSARDVLKGTAPAEKLDAHIVFVGTSAVGLRDVRASPIEEAVPGVEIQAQIVEQVLSQTLLRRPDYADGAEFLCLAAIGLLFVLLLPRLPAAPMAVVAASGIAIAVLLPWLAFDRAQLLIDPIYPPITLAAIYVSGSAVSFMQTERERRQIRNAFNLYLAPDQVAAVTLDPTLLKLGGELREITVMFTDVRGFTRISEQFDPPGLTHFMNSFLTPMTELIQARSGTIDKYMGDSIMAFWNAPLTVEQHAARACETALAMQARLIDLDAEWKAEAEAEGHGHIPVNIGIGLNTGQATVGNFGSSQRLAYSCLGDEVNLASRLESQCKTYGVGIIIGENTCREVSGFATMELDLVIVKGKSESERIYALLGDNATAGRPEFRTLVRRQNVFLKHYRSGGFADAHSAIAECVAAAKALGWRQGYYEIMAQRVDGLIAHPPDDWTGVHVATEK